MEQAVRTDFDRRNSDWYIDKLVQIVVFMGGISAIVFIVGIFVFITKINNTHRAGFCTMWQQALPQ